MGYTTLNIKQPAFCPIILWIEFTGWIPKENWSMASITTLIPTCFGGLKALCKHGFSYCNQPSGVNVASAFLVYLPCCLYCFPICCTNCTSWFLLLVSTPLCYLPLWWEDCPPPWQLTFVSLHETLWPSGNIQTIKINKPNTSRLERTIRFSRKHQNSDPNPFQHI